MDDGEQRRRRVRSRTGGPHPAEPVSVRPVSGEPVSGEPVSGEPVSGEPVSAETVSAEPAEAEVAEVAGVEVAAVDTMAVSDEVAVEPVVTARPSGSPRAVREPWRPDPPRVPTAEDKESERGLRGLIGGGSSQVSVTAAMRARDSSRPTEADLARAAATLAIVHRGWVPRDSA